MEVEQIGAEAIDVILAVRRECLEHGGIDWMAPALQLLELERHPLHVVEDDHVRDELVVLDLCVVPRYVESGGSRRSNSRQPRCELHISIRAASTSR